MRLSRTLPAAALLLAGLAPGAQAEPPRERVLAVKARWFGADPYCPDTACQIKIKVRDGEQYLHLVSGGTPGTPAFDVRTGAGVTRVCGITQAGAVPIGGSTDVVIRAVIDPACGAPALYGSLIAFFAEREVSFAEAVQSSEPDQDRMVAGGY